MSDEKKQDEKHPEGVRIGSGTLQAKDKDEKVVSVKLSGKFYVNGK